MNNRARPGHRVIDALTEREYDVLECAARGLSCIETGRELFIEEQTVKFHRTHIFEKLHAKNASHAVSIGYEKGILQTETSLPLEVFINGVKFQVELI